MKTIKYVYESVLIELNKVQAPTLKIYEFVYYLNKAIQQLVNKKYNLYETSQQITDDLLGLKKEKTLQLSKNEINAYSLDSDYYHILNCVCTFGDENILARQLKENAEGLVLNNYYNKPSRRNPYYKLQDGKLIILSGNNTPDEVTIQYLKHPKQYSLTIEDLENIDFDSSLGIDEFPDYMINEIINELVYLVLERSLDPRIQTNPQITQTIFNPTLQS